MKFDWKTTLCLSGFSLLFVPLAQAQFCTLTNASLNGSYGYVASQSGMQATTSGTGTTGTGTTTGTTGTGTTGSGTTGTGTSTSSYSNTGTGNLIGGITGGNLFAYSGVWIFNGQGSIFATAMPGATATAIGTYNVNSDCSLTVSIRDAFANTTSSTNTTANSTPPQLAGVILGHGSEIDLTSASSVTGSSTSTTGTGTTGTGATGTGTSGTTSTNAAPVLQIKLVRVLYNNGCSDSNLSGLYGFVLNPIPIQTTSTEPRTVIGYVDFNGTGQIVAIPSLSPQGNLTTGASSTFSALDYTGTYTVYPDCSGTMTISSSSGTSTTGTGTGTTGTGTTGTTGTGTTGTGAAANSITINFVVTPPEVPVGGLTTGAVAGAPNLVLSYSQGDAAGSGYALAQ